MSNYSGSSFDENNANTSWYKAFHLIPNRSEILDVGCSSGNFGVELINRKHCIVDGIEIDTTDYKEAKTKLRNVHNLNIEQDSLEVLQNKYDIVYFGDVIEHLVNPVETLIKVKDVLAPKGKVLFSIPNMTHIAVRLALLKGDFGYTETGLLDKTHLHFYGLEEIYRVFTEAGYKIDHIDFVKQDYPKALIKQWLKGLGLEATDKIYKEMSKPEAAAFQFVGTAVVTNTKELVKRPQFGPINLYDKYHNDMIENLQTKIEIKAKKYSELEKKYTHLSNRWEELRHRPIKFAAKSISKKINRKLSKNKD